MYQDIKKAIIEGFERLGVYRILSLGGTTKAHYVSPKGLYSRARSGENALSLQILKDEGNKYVIPLQTAVVLENGDVILTDDRNHIQFKYGNNIIEMSGDVNQLGDYSHIGNRTQDGVLTVLQNIQTNNITGLNGGALSSNVSINTTGNLDAATFSVNGTNGASGTFTSQDGKTITVVNGIVTSIT